MIQWRCGHCGEVLEFPQSVAGTRIACAICGTPQIVPDHTQAISASEPSPRRTWEAPESSRAPEGAPTHSVFIMPPEEYWRRLRSSVANGVVLALLVWSLVGCGGWGAWWLMVLTFGE